MTSLRNDEVLADPLASARDSIRQKEAAGDWEGALHDYERAQQLRSRASANHVDKDATLQQGVLRCLLELGHFESVLNQVNGMVRTRQVASAEAPDPNTDRIEHLAIEAAWRLGRWDTLSDLVTTVSGCHGDPETLYQVSLGSAFLGIKQKDANAVSSSLREARSAIMDGVTSLARESYARSYDHVVRLQTLREIEEVSLLLCSGDGAGDGMCFSDQTINFGWDRRLDFVSMENTSVVKVRVALSRLAQDPSLEGSLFLNLGKRARKNGLRNIAANSLAQAEAAFLSIPDRKKANIEMSSLQIQVAKLKHDCGEGSAALRMLGLENVETIADLEAEKLKAESLRLVQCAINESGEDISDDFLLQVFATRVLQSTRWMIEGGLKAGTEIVKRFRIIRTLKSDWEEGMYGIHPVFGS
jgi:hypothetical protein